jgi:hypothetical protein
VSRVLAFPSPAPQPAPQPVWASAAESAKLLKAALKRRFPATRFSVTLDRGTAYGCCNVRWVDGPSERLVETVTGPFEGEGFDGSQDLAYSIRNTLPDGRRTGLRLISTGRHISPAFARTCAAQVAQYFGVEPPEIREREGGNWDVPNDSVHVVGTHDYWSQLVYRAACDRSRYQLEER